MRLFALIPVAFSIACPPQKIEHCGLIRNSIQCSESYSNRATNLDIHTTNKTIEWVGCYFDWKSRVCRVSKGEGCEVGK
jgi:hypothetical protein